MPATPPQWVMSEQQFDARLKKIDEHYWLARHAIEVRRDQEMDHLLVECGWPQQRIDEHMEQKVRQMG
jgi:hypothetical protein